MNKITQYLNQHIVGNVFDKMSIRAAYATDRSILKILPRFVAIPENTDDIRKLLRFCHQLAARDFHLPVTVRGGGHDKTGAAIGSGLILSLKRMNKIQEIDVRSRLVRVQAGATLGELNQALALHGLTLPISAQPQRTIGGLIANYTTDSFSAKHQSLSSYVERAEIVLATGDCLQTTALSSHKLARQKSANSFSGSIFRDLDNLILDNADLLTQIGQKPLDRTGYAMLTHVKRKRSFDLLPLFFASQGSLGVITELILRCETLNSPPRHLAASFRTIDSALDFLYAAQKTKLLDSQLYDLRIIRTAAEHGKKSNLFNKRLLNGFVVLLSFDDNPRLALKKIKRCFRWLPKATFAVAETKTNTPEFQELHSLLLSYLNDGIRGERSAFIDDAYIPTGQLTVFLRGLAELESNLNTTLPLFGSFTTQTYSVRPELLLDSVPGRQLALRLLKDYTALLHQHGAALAGSGPEGRVKAIAIKPYLDGDQVALYQAVKDIFDPNQVLNPGIKFQADPKNVICRFRTAYLEKIML